MSHKQEFKLWENLVSKYYWQLKNKKMKKGKLLITEECSVLYTREGNLITMYQTDDIMFPKDFLGRRLAVEFRADRNHRILGDSLIIKSDLK